MELAKLAMAPLTWSMLKWTPNSLFLGPVAHPLMCGIQSLTMLPSSAGVVTEVLGPTCHHGDKEENILPPGSPLTGPLHRLLSA